MLAYWCSDAKKMEELASKLSDSSELSPGAEGNDISKLLGAIADRAKAGDFLYTKFFAIGLFRLLELTGENVIGLPVQKSFAIGLFRLLELTGGNAGSPKDCLGNAIELVMSCV